MAEAQEVEKLTAQLLQKAFSHSRGNADFVNVVIEKLESPFLKKIPPLTVSTETVTDYKKGREKAEQILSQMGVSRKAAAAGVTLLQQASNLRGAAILHRITGQRLDDRGLKGLRVSRMDWDHDAYRCWVKDYPSLSSLRVAEALALATKVSSSSYTIAELCWSDDPYYVTGYVAGSSIGYKRITHLKQKGDLSGGRIFFVSDDVKLDEYIRYLEKEPVWIG